MAVMHAVVKSINRKIW